jgi:4-amino-4-deoxy-L-arabinose transferase-like glycosyltransferase
MSRNGRMRAPWHVPSPLITRPKFWWLCSGLLALTFLPSLNFYFVGEEAILPLTSLEMWHRGDWLKHTIYGLPVGHNPLFNWLLIPLASTAGWEHGLLLSRALMVASCLLTALVLAGLARRLFGDRGFAAFAAAVYLSLGDLFFWRGALAYIDPLYALFVFGAIAALWIACEERSTAWLLVAMAALTAAFLTKTLTAYVFYGAAGFVMLFRREYRRFLLGPASIVVHVAGLGAAVFWLKGAVGGQSHGRWMLQEVLLKLVPEGVGAYLRRLVAYPADVLLRLSPPCALALYLLFRRRVTAPEAAAAHFWTAVAIAGLNFLPYWLAPQGGIRYLYPLFPLFALVFARLIWRAREEALRLTIRWLVVMVVLKLVFVLVAYPYYQATFRGANYLAATNDVLSRRGDRKLYVNDLTATGLSVATQIDILQLPGPPLEWPPDDWDDALLLTALPQQGKDRVVAKYHLGGDDLYLVCRGAACAPRTTR